MPPFLIFRADKTTLNPDCHKKVHVPNQDKTPIVPNDVELPHITAICCSNASDVKLQLKIILPALKKLPKELKLFTSNSKAFFSSSPRGWYIRDTFLWFTIISIN